METSASFEARYAPLPYPTVAKRLVTVRQTTWAYNARRFLLTVAQCCRCDPNVGPVHKGYLRPVGRKGWLGECNTLSFLHGKADKRNGGESNES